MVEKSKLVRLGTSDDGEVEVLWSKMPGFPYWPSRRATSFEELTLKNNPKAPQLVEGTDYVCVIFLGTKYQSGHVVHSCVAPLKSETFSSHFSAETYRKNKDYAVGLLEALRILNAGGQKEAVNGLIISRTLKDNTSMNSVMAARDDNCSRCCGTRISGPQLQCEQCKKKYVHFHCFKPPLKRLKAEGRQKWFCDGCSVPLQSQDTMMFPVIKGGVSKLQCRFKLKPPKVSWGRVYQQESDSESDLEPDQEAGRKGQKITKKSTGNLRGKEKEKLALAATQGNAKEEQPSKAGSPALMNGKKSSGADAADAQSPVAESGLKAKQTQDSLKSPVPVCEEEDEKCFICGDVGTLMLCDFPACPRVYHKMCVVRVANQGVDEDWASSDTALRGSGRAKGTTEPADDDTWFCPLHNCLGCGALEKTPYSLRTLNPPAALITQLKIGPQGIIRKPLRSCSSCPSSLCRDCEDDLGAGRPLFRSKKFEDVLKPATRCLNCLSSEPRLKLARVLEGAWVRMCRSRLAVPFLCAVLPGVDTRGSIFSGSDTNHGLPLNGTLKTAEATGAAGEAAAAEQLTLSWERHFKELFRSVPSLTTQLFQATFFSSSVCSRSQYLELNQINVKENAAILADVLSRNRTPPSGLLDILTRIRNLAYSSVLDLLLDLASLRRRVATACAPSSQPPDAPQQPAEASAPKGKRGRGKAPQVVISQQAALEESAPDNTSSSQSPNGGEEPVHDILDAFDTLLGVCVNYLVIHKMELWTQSSLLQTGNSSVQAGSAGLSREDAITLSREYSAETGVTSTGSSTGVQLLTSSSDFDAERRIAEEADEVASKAKSIKSSKSAKSAKSAKSNKVDESGSEGIDIMSADDADSIPDAAQLPKRRNTGSKPHSKGASHGDTSELIQSPVAAVIVPSETAEDKDESRPEHAALHRLVDRSKNTKDSHQLYLTHFLYLWRLSCECRFIGNTPRSNTATGSSSSSGSGSAGTGVVATGGYSHLFVGSRSLAGWAAYLAEGAREEEALTRRRAALHVAANEQSARDQVADWLDDSVQIEEKLSTKRAALSLLDLGEDGRNLANEGVTLLEHRYGEPSLPWSKISKRFSKDDTAAAKGDDTNLKHRRGRSGSISSADGPKDDGAKVAAAGAMAVDEAGLEAEEAEAPDADVLLDEPFEERPDLLRGDDAWLMLEHMQDLTVRALHLQERFRKEYRQQQQQLLSGAGLPHPLSLGDGQLLRELKFSNDNLRWRLRQKQASLGNAQDTVALLKTNVLQLEQKLDRKTTEWRDAVEETSRLTQQVAKLEAENKRLKAAASAKP